MYVGEKGLLSLHIGSKHWMTFFPGLYILKFFFINYSTCTFFLDKSAHTFGTFKFFMNAN